MGREILLNAFSMNCVAHQSPGLWRHPRDRSADYNRLSYWTDLAQTLERGRFGQWHAEIFGMPGVLPDRAATNFEGDGGAGGGDLIQAIGTVDHEAAG